MRSRIRAVMPGGPGESCCPNHGPCGCGGVGPLPTALEAAAGITLVAIQVIPLVTETPESMLATGSYAGVPRLAAMTWELKI